MFKNTTFKIGDLVKLNNEWIHKENLSEWVLTSYKTAKSIRVRCCDLYGKVLEVVKLGDAGSATCWVHVPAYNATLHIYIGRLEFFNK